MMHYFYLSVVTVAVLLAFIRSKQPAWEVGD